MLIPVDLMRLLPLTISLEWGYEWNGYDASYL